MSNATIKTTLQNITAEDLAQAFPAADTADPTNPKFLAQVAVTLGRLADTMRPWVINEAGQRVRDGETTQRRLLAVDYMTDAVDVLQSTVLTLGDVAAKANKRADDATAEVLILKEMVAGLVARLASIENNGTALQNYTNDLALRVDAVEANAGKRRTMPAVDATPAPTPQPAPEPVPTPEPTKPIKDLTNTATVLSDKAKKAREVAEAHRNKAANAQAQAPAPTHVEVAQDAIAQAVAMDTAPMMFDEEL